MRVLRQNKAVSIAFCRVWGDGEMACKMYVAALQMVVKMNKGWFYKLALSDCEAIFVDNVFANEGV